MWLEDSAAVLKQRSRSTGALGADAAPVASKALRCALSQQRLAVREHREAARLRPRDVETQKRLQGARQSLRALQSALETPKPKPLRRFLAHYNLSIRYWDLGKPKQAIAEAERACDELRAANFATGCAEHNLEVMTQVHAHFRSEEKRLLDACQQYPSAVGPGYELGILYFDKRMLVRAEEQLKAARDRARSACSLQLIGLDRRRQQRSEAAGPKGWPVWLTSMEEPRSMRMAELLEDIGDDLDFLAGVRLHWCAEEEAGKVEDLQDVGIIDGERRQLLPCLRKRYSQECQECDQWWSELSRCTSVSLHIGAPPPQRRPSSGRLVSAGQRSAPGLLR